MLVVSWSADQSAASVRGYGGDMLLSVQVQPADRDAPAPADGTPVHVEIRDVSLADAPASVLAAGDGVTSGAPGWSADVAVDLPASLPVGGSIAVWARVAASGAESTSAGDWITMQSFPLQQGVTAVTVRPVS